MVNRGGKKGRCKQTTDININKQEGLSVTFVFRPALPFAIFFTRTFTSTSHAHRMLYASHLLSCAIVPRPSHQHPPPISASHHSPFFYFFSFITPVRVPLGHLEEELSLFVLFIPSTSHLCHTMAHLQKLKGGFRDFKKPSSAYVLFVPYTVHPLFPSLAAFPHLLLSYTCPTPVLFEYFYVYFYFCVVANTRPRTQPECCLLIQRQKKREFSRTRLVW